MRLLPICYERVQRMAQLKSSPIAASLRRSLSSAPQRDTSQNDIIVTKTSNDISCKLNGISAPFIQSDETNLVESLLVHTSSLVDLSASNVIAFSGGVDSSLAAALVYRVFHSSPSIDRLGSVRAVLGVSNSLPKRQLLLAREVASSIGIELLEERTTEGADGAYIENKGQACFVCKSHLYAALEAVSNRVSQMSNKNEHRKDVILYNGTNADDTQDPTRLGLVAASNFSVRSPLINITKEEVRRASRHLGLPNWNFAASPCLRSRLALGVEATETHLRAVNVAEERVRGLLGLDDTMDMRVRMLAGKRAMVELDRQWFEGNTDAEDILRSQGFEAFCEDLGFDGGIGIRPFKSGSVSK